MELQAAVEEQGAAARGRPSSAPAARQPARTQRSPRRPATAGTRRKHQSPRAYGGRGRRHATATPEGALGKASNDRKGRGGGAAEGGDDASPYAEELPGMRSLAK